MSKNEYLDALKKALAGLPPDVAAKTMAYYEQRFIDSLAAGKLKRKSPPSWTNRARSR